MGKLRYGISVHPVEVQTRFYVTFREFDTWQKACSKVEPEPIQGATKRESPVSARLGASERAAQV